MLPPVLLMHRVDSSHSESHSGGLVKLPGNYLLGEIFQTSLFYEHFFFSLGVPLQGPPIWGSLPGLPPRVLGGPRCQGAPG